MDEPDKPYIAKCNQCDPVVRRTFESEKAARVWASMHTADANILYRNKDHKPVFAMKARVQ